MENHTADSQSASTRLRNSENNEHKSLHKSLQKSAQKNAQKRARRNRARSDQRTELQTALFNYKAALESYSAVLMSRACIKKSPDHGSLNQIKAETTIQILSMTKDLIERSVLNNSSDRAALKPEASQVTSPVSSLRAQSTQTAKPLAEYQRQQTQHPQTQQQKLLQPNTGEGLHSFESFQLKNAAPDHPLIVLYKPEIPPNTGTIARLCAAFRMPLCLIGPLGFDVSEKAFRRAGLDYWPWVDLFVFNSWEDFISRKLNKRLIFIETSGKKSIGEYEFKPGDALIFGSETKGIPTEILNAPYQCDALEFNIPMWQQNVRSINIANSVSIAASHALHSTRPG